MSINLQLYIDHLVFDYMSFLNKTYKDKGKIAVKVQIYRQQIKVIESSLFNKIVIKIGKDSFAHSFILKDPYSNFKAGDIFLPENWSEPELKFSIANLNDRISYKFNVNWMGLL